MGAEALGPNEVTQEEEWSEKELSAKCEFWATPTFRGEGKSSQRVLWSGQTMRRKIRDR